MKKNLSFLTLLFCCVLLVADFFINKTSCALGETYFPCGFKVTCSLFTFVVRGVASGITSVQPR